MVISIHQPDYIPYLGYFYKISQSDIFVFLDDVQFSNDNIHNWNRIKTPQGECRLKIPVEYKFGDSINQVRPRDDLRWQNKHLKTLEMNYARAPFFKDIYPKFKEILLSDYHNLADMNIMIIKFLCIGFGFDVEFMRSSDLNITTPREKRVIDICTKLGGTVYISGNGARSYQVEEHFTDGGIELKYTDYQPIEYNQLWDNFLPNMSVLDYVFNCGFDFDYVTRKLEEI